MSSRIQGYLKLRVLAHRSQTQRQTHRKASPWRSSSVAQIRRAHDWNRRL